jgi:hypothetical protein
MRIESYQIFSQLLESYVNEASTSLSLIMDNPGGDAVIKHLHKNLSLAHDQNYKQIEKISWSDLKEPYRGSWVIIIGSKGTGAIRSKGDTYNAFASVGQDLQQASDGRGGNILDFLKTNIGKLQKFYVGRSNSDVSDKQSKRASAKKGLTREIDQDYLMRKFKPLWSRAMTAAIADIKGHVANMIKNDAFEKAKKKLSQVENLQNAVEALESGSMDIPGSVKSAVNIAVLMAASNHYPEQTGSITKGYSSGYNAQFNEGPRQLLKDIANGDQRKLGTVLGFFKRALITG